MELTNEFSVPVPFDRAWEVLNDVELIAPCMPGAQLEEIEGDEHRGTVKVKVGPITAQYKGAAVFTERDRENGKIVIDASGRDTRGQGSASAIITLSLVETDGRTDVSVESDVTIKGKVAQFGRGMIADVAGNLLTQFVECLEGKLEEPAAAPTAAADAAGTEPAPAAAGDTADVGDATPTAPTVRKIDSAPAEPVDLLGAAGTPVAKRILPIVVVVLILLLIGRSRSRRRRA